MLNFMSPWMTKYTREKHDGKRDPSIDMRNRKSSGTKCGYVDPARPSKARLLRVIASLEAHIAQHPNNGVAERHLAKVTARLTP